MIDARTSCTSPHPPRVSTESQKVFVLLFFFLFYFQTISKSIKPKWAILCPLGSSDWPKGRASRGSDLKRCCGSQSKLYCTVSCSRGGYQILQTSCEPPTARPHREGRSIRVRFGDSFTSSSCSEWVTLFSRQTESSILVYQILGI